MTRLWQQVLRADTAALDDFLAWINEESAKLAAECLNAPNWETVLARKAQHYLLANLSNALTLADSEERARAEYRRRNT